MAKLMKNSGIQWIGDIPKHWNVRKLKYIFNIIGGNGFPEDLQGKCLGDYPFYKTSDINGNDIYVKKSNNYVSKNDVVEKNFNVIPKNSIIISKIGEALKKNHRKISTSNCCIDNNLEALTMNDENNLLFLYYISTTINMYWFDNGGTIPSVNNFKLKNFFLPIPPLDEQQRIANYLDEKCSKIDETIEKEKAIIEKLKEYKQSLITETVTKGVNPNVPLKKIRLKYLVRFNPNFNENIKNNIQVSFLPMECLKNGYMFPKTDYLNNVKGKYTYFAENDIVMAKVTPCFENGNISIAKNLINNIGFGSSELYVFRCFNINTKYMLYFLQNDIFKNECISTMYGTGGLKRVSSNFIYNYYITVPPMEEQEEIAKYLDEKCNAIENAITQRETLIDKLTQYKKSLIYECVTGKKEI